jgi:hypothetical protein
VRSGDTLIFALGDDPSGPPCRAEVKAVLFTGTSRWLPDGRSDPWRDLLIVETEADGILIRDRIRMRNGEEIISEPRWSLGTLETAAMLLRARSGQATDADQRRLYERAAKKLAQWSRAETV